MDMWRIIEKQSAGCLRSGKKKQQKQKKGIEESALRVNLSSKEANFVIWSINEGLDLSAKECLCSARKFKRGIPTAAGYTIC